MVNLESPWEAEQFTIVKIVDSTTIQIMTPSNFYFPMNDTKVIIPHRFIFNSWPSEVTPGKIHKGTLLKAAVISFFCEETEQQIQGGFSDPQLS